MRILWMLLAVVAFADVCSAGDLDDKLAAALRQHKTAVQDASSELEKGFRAAIKAAAAEERLDDIQTLLDARTLFLEDGTLPDRPSLEAAVEEYAESRTSSARQVFDAYREVIDSLNASLKFDESTAVTRQMKRFVNQERAAIGLKPRYSIEPSGPVEEPQLGSFKECVQELAAELKRIAGLETTARRVAEHKESLDRLHAKMQRMRFEVVYQVADVSAGRWESGAYDLTLSRPESLSFLDNMVDSRRLVTPRDPQRQFSECAYTYEIRNQELKDDIALQLDRQWRLRISGKGGVVVTKHNGIWSDSSLPASVFDVFSATRPFEDDYSTVYRYHFVLTDYRRELVRATTDEAPNNGTRKTN